MDADWNRRPFEYFEKRPRGRNTFIQRGVKGDVTKYALAVGYLAVPGSANTRKCEDGLILLVLQQHCPLREGRGLQQSTDSRQDVG